MLNFFKKLFAGNQTDYAALVKAGAVIIDVRTESEYRSGHIKGSKNIPLQVLEQKANSLSKEKPIITCCASGMRSAAAKNILLNRGFKEVYNGGGWQRLRSKI